MDSEGKLLRTQHVTWTLRATFATSTESQLLVITGCCFAVSGMYKIISGIHLKLLLPYLNDASNCYT